MTGTFGPIAALLAGALVLAAPRTSRADDFIVYSPYVTKGQTEFELRGAQQLNQTIQLYDKKA